MSEQKIVIVVFLLFVISLSVVSAVNVGISPATMTFENVLRNGYSEKSVVVSVDSEEEIFVSAQPRGEIAGWMNYSSENFTVSKEEPYSLKIAINPPGDVPNGNYTGFLRVMTAELGEGVEGNAVSIVRTALDLSITVEITDIEIRDCRAYEFSVESVEKGDDVVFKFNVVNNGNIILTPRVVIDIWDRDQVEILKSEEFSDKKVLPTTEDDFSVSVSSDNLDLGQYWADVSVIDCYVKQTLTFDVLEPGALKTEGVLLTILNNKTAEVGDTVPIEVGFKNTGEKELLAYFKGKVTLGDRIVDVLETDKMSVPVDTTEHFNLFFTPAEEGKHIISGRVFYNNKKTFESSSVLEVFSKAFSFKGFLGWLFVPIIYAILILLIGFLFFKIRKERKLYSSKLRQLGK